MNVNLKQLMTSIAGIQKIKDGYQLIIFMLKKDFYVIFNMILQFHPLDI